MPSKQLRYPAAQPAVQQKGHGYSGYQSAASAPRVSSKGRQGLLPSVQQEAWKNGLPAYQYQIRTGKKMNLPQRNEDLIGGYQNTGNMQVSVAKRYMEAKAAQDAKQEQERQRRNAELNPFDGLMDD